MRATRWLQLAVVAGFLSAATPSHAIISLPLEVGGGLTLRGPQSPMASARVGLNLLSLLDVGLRGEYVFGSSPSVAGGSGYQAWMVFPELRLATPTPIISADLALGAGLGNLKGINLTSTTYDANGAAKFYGQVGVGVKVNIPTTDIYVRAEGSASLFTGVSGQDIGNGLNPGLLPVYQVQLLLGYTGIGF